REQDFLEMEIAWRRRLRDDKAIVDIQREIAEAMVRKAEGVIAAHWPSATSVATHFIEEAIDRLRRIGGDTSRVDELRGRLQSLQREAIAEMKPIEVKITVTQAVLSARKHVVGKPALEALLALATVYSPPAIAEVEQEVREQLQEEPLKRFLPHSYLGSRGTV